MNLAGQRFGRWLALEPAARTDKGPRWLCRCECGVERSVNQRNLTAGLSQSCGCWNLERRCQGSSAANRRHGQTHTPLWNVWQSMRQRCNNPKHKSYRDYGARGISICERWASFEAFAADMGERPLGMQIDRIDNDKGYEPGNCHWTTARQNTRNRRSNAPVAAFGETKLPVEWAEDSRCQVTHASLTKRIAAGWEPERALMTPKYAERRHYIARQAA